MSRDKHNGDSTIPEPDAPAAAAEKARAEGFAALVDSLVSGDPLPPAMDSDDRALLETATMIVASTREVELAPGRRQTLVEEALERAILGRRHSSNTPVPTPIPTEILPVPLASRRRAAQLIPWAVAAVAAAAALLLLFMPPQTIEQQRNPTAPVARAFRSRPSDALIGKIQPAEAQQASERLDTLFADRMDGYRELRFQQKLGGVHTP